MAKLHKFPLKIIDLGEGGFHIFCTVEIEGRAINALIDTGANKSVLSYQLASQLHTTTVHDMEENHTAGIGKEEVETSFVILEKLSIEGIVFTEQIMGLIDLDHVEDMYIEMELEPFQVIIGGDILNTASAVIDYGKSTLSLAEPEVPFTNSNGA
jgi:predicted aspartyl protease